MQGQSTFLGTLVCKHCNRIIDQVDTAKVTILYGLCEEHKQPADIPGGGENGMTEEERVGMVCGIPERGEKG